MAEEAEVMAPLTVAVCEGVQSGLVREAQVLKTVTE